MGSAHYSSKHCQIGSKILKMVRRMILRNDQNNERKILEKFNCSIYKSVTNCVLCDTSLSHSLHLEVRHVLRV